jgi:FtsZ-binding cell division protein ZapB
LQRRLDQAIHKISSSEVESTTLSSERDRALKKLQEACENISELMNRLESREKELHNTQKQLSALQQNQQGNEHLGHDVAASKHGNDTLQLENKSLKSDNGTLRREQQALQREAESLRSDNNTLRREQESLINENRSLRSNNKALIDENDDLRHNFDSVQQELEIAREELESLEQEVKVLEQESVTFKEDNESLVRHNEKYFSENKLLRRENSGFERSIHDLHDENLRLKEEVEFLKQQLDHCRPIGKEDEISGQFSRNEDEEHMTSAFFVPDITIQSNEISAAVDVTSNSNKPPVLPELTSHSDKLELPDSLTGADNTFQSERSMIMQETAKQVKGKQVASVGRETTVQGHKVAFALPEASRKSKLATNVANQGTKRRSNSRLNYHNSSRREFDPLQDNEESIEVHSRENTKAMNHSLDIGANSRSHKAASAKTHRSTTKQTTETQNITVNSTRARSTHQSRTNTQNLSGNMTAESQRDSNTKEPCPALSRDARRVLDRLCEHNCGNCIVCSRITSHRGAINSAEVAEGKKRVRVPRPVPVTDRMPPEAAVEYTDEHTMRPSQPPGHALALVIKGLEDEAAHMKMELARRQACYSELNSSLGRRERKDLAADIKDLLRRLEVKNDQIYALYDVLEGQKASGQAMSEEELEMTIFSITGLSARDGSEQVTWDGVRGGGVTA